MLGATVVPSARNRVDLVGVGRPAWGRDTHFVTQDGVPNYPISRAQASMGVQTQCTKRLNSLQARLKSLNSC
jgi:hypothetical protein